MKPLPIDAAGLRSNPLGPERSGPEKADPPTARPTQASLLPGVRKALPATYRRGGRVKRTGWAKVHKGETVVTAAATAMGAGKTKKPRAKRAKKKA